MKSFVNKYRLKIFISVLFLFFLFLFFWTDPTSRTAGTIKIYDRNDKLLFETSSSLNHQQSVNIDRVPKELQDAVITEEDQRFRSHIGVDIIAIIRAVTQNIKAKQIVSGASTIPQQLVRFTVINPQSPSSVSFIRKIRESLMAVRLSATKSKKEVLEMYLNSMHFGRNTYGVEAASRLYFDKDVDNLSIAESALIASLISNPSAFDPINHPEDAKVRRDALLDKMYENKLISEESYNRAKQESLPVQITPSEIIAPHVVQMVLSQIKSMNLKNSTGLSIHTSIDADWYELTKNIAANQVSKLKIDHDLSSAAVIIIENNTGQILSLLGGIDYFDTENGGQNNMAITLRQPGSAMKPVTYAAAFEDKIATPATAIDDSPKVYLTKKGEGFLPHNYDGRYRGVVLAREALASSYNLPAVEMLSRIGIDRFLDLAHKMGVTSMTQTDRYDLALTLGGGEVSLLDLTTVYSTFARMGKYLPATIINSIVDNNGNTVYQNKTSEPKQILDEKVAYLITDILSDKNARIPTFGQKNLLAVGDNVAVKTGTTTDWHDNWTVGYTPDYTVGVWVGNADNHPMRDITGITGAAPIWNEVIRNVIKFKGSSKFIEPYGVIEKEICAWDGLLPSEKCSERYMEKFIDGTEPQQYTDLTQKPTYLQSSDIQIISPVEGTTYEVGSRDGEIINFELTRYSGLERVDWILDGRYLSQTGCANGGFVCHWTPEVGGHILKVQLTPMLNSVSEVHFDVTQYQKGW